MTIFHEIQELLKLELCDVSNTLSSVFISLYTYDWHILVMQLKRVSQ